MTRDLYFRPPALACVSCFLPFLGGEIEQRLAKKRAREGAGLESAEKGGLKDTFVV